MDRIKKSVYISVPLSILLTVVGPLIGESPTWTKDEILKNHQRDLAEMERFHDEHDDIPGYGVDEGHNAHWGENKSYPDVPAWRLRKAKVKTPSSAKAILRDRILEEDLDIGRQMEVTGVYQLGRDMSDMGEDEDLVWIVTVSKGATLQQIGLVNATTGDSYFILPDENESKGEK